MKKIYPFLLLCATLVLVSCSQVYHFVQVFETQSANEKAPLTRVNDGLCYEDDYCAVFYTLWAEGGDASFAFLNKTDEIIYIDLTKSFFIRNGLANDYYHDREWSESNSSSASVTYMSGSSAYAARSKTYGASAAYVGNFGQLPLSLKEPVATSASVSRTGSSGFLFSSSVSNSYATSKAVGVTEKEKPVIAIPPHSTKILTDYSISNALYKDCDLTRFPSEQSSVSFTKDDTPLSFENYVTYIIGNNPQERKVENKFFVSKITNYARPYTKEYVKRENKPCQNMTDDTSSNYKNEYPVSVYDIRITIDTYNSFYLEYQTVSTQKLYNFKTGLYYYNETYDGYVKEDPSKYSFIVPTKSSKK